MPDLATWIRNRWASVLRVAGLALALSALSQLVLNATAFSHNRRYLDLLADRAWEGWLLTAVWTLLLGARWRTARDSTERLLDRPLEHGGLVAVVLVGVASPFMNAYFSAFTHPLLATVVAWTVWPFCVVARDRIGPIVERVPQSLRSFTAGPMAPWALALAGVLIFFVQSYRRHLWFGSGGKDLGLFHQSVWLLSRLETPNNTVMGMHAFADHMEIIDVAAAPLQWLWPSAGALLLFQAVIVGLGAVPVFELASRKLESRGAGLALAVVYLSCLDMQNAVMFDWNPTTCGAGLIPWVVWFFERRRAVAFGVALAALALTKENLVLYGLGLCLTLAVGSRRRLPLAAAAVLAVWFAVEMKFLFPIFRGDGFRHLRYEALGDSAGEIVVNAVASPYRSFALLFTPGGKINGLLAPFASVAFACWLAPRWAFAFAPALLERFWSSHSNRWWGHHYGAGIGVVAVLAAIDGLARFKKLVRGPHARELMGVAIIAVLLSSLALSTWGRSGYGPLWWWRHPYYTTAQDRIDANAIIDQIPAEASVAAQNHLMPHLSARREIYQINRPIRAEYVALDLVQSAWPYQRHYARDLGRELLGSGYGIIACQGAAILMRRGDDSIECPALGLNDKAVPQPTAPMAP
ncbi:MAG: DUF2079 domain-containing protein [Myxococcota bacterium]